MQSDGNCFNGYAFLDSFNKIFCDEDNILDQIYNSKYVRIIIMMILIFYNIKKIHNKTKSSTKTQYYSLL